LSRASTHQIPAIFVETPCVAYFLTLECFLHRGWRVWWRTEQDGPMEPKIALLFLLIASVVGLSHLNDDVVGRMRRHLGEGRWREILPRRRRV
jgi:hypothetical protein